MGIGITHYLTVSAILFTIGIFGIFLNRKNVIIMLMSIELILLSVLCLILAFFQTAGLFLLIGAEFLAMILVIVYIGAVAVLFLFVVMMLDVNFVELREGFLNYLPIGGTIGLILLVELIAIATTWTSAPGIKTFDTSVAQHTTITNTQALGQILYTDYLYLFQTAGIILLIAMIGAIVLVQRTRKGVHKQNIPQQVTRPKQEVIAIRNIPPRRGI